MELRIRGCPVSWPRTHLLLPGRRVRPRCQAGWTRRSDPHQQPPAASGYVALCKGSWEASEAVLPPLCASRRRGLSSGLFRPSAESRVCSVGGAAGQRRWIPAPADLMDPGCARSTRDSRESAVPTKPGRKQGTSVASVNSNSDLGQLFWANQ